MQSNAIAFDKQWNRMGEIRSYTFCFLLLLASVSVSVSVSFRVVFSLFPIAIAEGSEFDNGFWPRLIDALRKITTKSKTDCLSMGKTAETSPSPSLPPSPFPFFSFITRTRSHSFSVINMSDGASGWVSRSRGFVFIRSAVCADHYQRQLSSTSAHSVQQIRTRVKQRALNPFVVRRAEATLHWPREERTEGKGILIASFVRMD